MTASYINICNESYHARGDVAVVMMIVNSAWRCMRIAQNKYYDVAYCLHKLKKDNYQLRQMFPMPN